MKRIKRYIIPAIIILLSGACSDEIIPSLKGDMIGYVFTFDEFGNFLDNHQGVAVTVYGPGTTYMATTHENGYFTVHEIPTGTYEIHFEKEGYCIVKQFGVKHLGGQPTILGLNDDRVYFMYEIQTTEITNLVLNKDTAFAEFRFHKGPEPEFLNVRLWFSDSPDFSATSKKYSSDFKFGVNGPNWNYWRPENLPFEPGTRVYYKGAINTKVSSVNRFEHNLDIFSNYYYKLAAVINNVEINPDLGNETEVYSFVLPD